MAANKYRYRRMTADQFRTALKELGMPEGHKFARLCGSAPSNVDRMKRGELPVPHYVALILSLLTLPGGMDMAHKLFDEMSEGLKDDERD